MLPTAPTYPLKKFFITNFEDASKYISTSSYLLISSQLCEIKMQFGAFDITSINKDL